MTMTARYDGTCKTCGGILKSGTLIEWTKGGGATHVTAGECAAVRALAATPAPSAKVDGVAALAAFLRAAGARGLKFPKVRFLAPGGGELRLSLAAGSTKYPGAVQVKLDGAWLGRIGVDGMASRDLACQPAIVATLGDIAADPAAAAAAYGALMGRCSFCNLALSDAGSVEVGYGPTCAKSYGLPHHPKGAPALTRIIG